MSEAFHWVSQRDNYHVVGGWERPRQRQGRRQRNQKTSGKRRLPSKRPEGTRQRTFRSRLAPPTSHAPPLIHSGSVSSGLHASYAAPSGGGSYAQWRRHVGAPCNGVVGPHNVAEAYGTWMLRVAAPTCDGGISWGHSAHDTMEGCRYTQHMDGCSFIFSRI